MRLFILFTVFSFFISEALYAQKKLPNLISKPDRKKVERARKFLNEGELYEGLKLLTKLRDDNMSESYFHEALVGVQKQILDQVNELRGEDNNDGEYFLHGKKPELEEPKSLSIKEVFVDNGLARDEENKIETIKELGGVSRKNRKKLMRGVVDKQEINDSTDQEEPIDLALGEGVDGEGFHIGKKLKQEEDELAAIDYKVLKEELIQNCRLATLKHFDADSASHFLRMLLVDTVDYDAPLKEDELTAYEDAYVLFRQKDYTRCAQSLEKIVSMHPKHFYAQLLLGDACYRMGLDSPTYQRYRYISLEWPDRPEGFERLSRYYTAKGLFKDAAANIIEALLVYPELQYWEQLGLILSKSGRKFDPHWISRAVYPIKTDKNYETIIAKKESPWVHYQQAKTVLYSYATPDGLLRENEISDYRYLELYGWMSMLVRSLDMKEKDKSKINFQFARSMDKMGFLDCYVFITLFHHDVYEAYRDFVKRYPKKAHDYFYVLLNWEDKRFDEYRK